jgi:IclR family KDG regulon transcriptional repressor
MPAYEIDAVTKTIRVLGALAGHERGLGVSELGRSLTLDKSSVFRILATLSKHGFVQQDSETRRYRLGPQLVVIGQAAFESFDLRREARPVMKRLTQATGMPTYLNVPGTTEVVCLEHIPNMGGINLYGRAGHTMPYHACPSGYVLLAFGPPERLEQVISRGMRRYASQTIVRPTALRRVVQQVRRQGYALGIDDLDEGVTSISVPVKNARGHVIGALGLAGFSQYFEGRLDELLERTFDAAQAISRGCAIPPLDQQAAE